MAKYRREFLVPYLRDIYALHLALHKLQERLAVLEHQKCSLERGAHSVAKPMAPCYEAANGVFLLCCGMYCFLMSFVMFIFNFGFLGWFFILCGIMAIILGALRYSLVSKENARKEERYNEKLAAYHQMQTKNEGGRKDIPLVADEILQCKAEIEKVKAALQRVYCTNVIPGRYQDIYAARFLYNWFDTGSPNDLDTAFNVFALLETNAKPDRIITDRTESILKYYLPLPKQHRSPEAQQKHTANMESKINRMNVSKEERNTYLAMIGSSADATAYFATADYLMKL